jgi:hypothetical protein
VWAERIGLDTGRVPLARPESADEALEIARILALSGAVT